MNDSGGALPALQHATLQQLAAAKALGGARAVPMEGGWALQVRYGEAKGLLEAQRSRRPRLFRRLETLVDYLRDIGVASFEVEVGASPPEAAPSRRRPDRAAALRRLHQLAEESPERASPRPAPIDSEISAALAEADDPATEWFPHKEFKREWAGLRAALLASEESP